MLLFGFWLLGILLIVLQTTVVPDLPRWLQQPDFIFLFCSYIAYRFPWFPALFLLFNIGWIMDIVAGVYPGFFTLSYLFGMLVLKILTYRNPFRESTSLILYVGLSYFLVMLFLQFAYAIILPEKSFRWSWNEEMLKTVLMMVVTLVIFPLANSYYELLLRHPLKKKPFRARRRNMGRS